ncbi:hypothetical protein HDK77DRAFT_502646 [Phyllosticta capitalensis]
MSYDWGAIIHRNIQQTNSIEECEEAMRQEIGNDRDKFRAALAWGEAENIKAMNRLNTPYPVEELVDGIHTINFFHNSSPDYKAWYDKMTHNARLPIPLGCTSKALYQLRPCPGGLLPDNKDKEDTMDEYDIMPPCFLGVNMNVPAPQDIPSPGNPLPATSPPPPEQNADQRKEQRTVESTELTTSEDGSTGFIFYQLGALEYTTFPTRPEHYPPRPNDFLSTDYYVVAKLSNSGMATELWIIQDKFLEECEEGDRPDEPDQDVGVLKLDNLKISMARLHSDNIRLLENRTFDTPITWLEQKHDQMELVNLRRMPDGSLVRLTVFP